MCIHKSCFCVFVDERSNEYSIETLIIHKPDLRYMLWNVVCYERDGVAVNYNIHLGANCNAVRKYLQSLFFCVTFKMSFK